MYKNQEKTFTTFQIACEFNISVETLVNALLKKQIIQYKTKSKQSWDLSPFYKGLGLTKTIKRRSVGRKYPIKQIIWTNEGRTFLFDILNKHFTYVKNDFK